MALEQLHENVYSINMNVVNSFMLIADDGITLIDTGTHGNVETILNAVQLIGKSPQDIRHILITHLHADHTGSLSTLLKEVTAPVYMHALDATMVSKGQASRPMKPAPGIIPRIMHTLMSLSGANRTVDPVKTNHEIKDADVLPIAGGIKVIHTPGHSVGHVSFLWEKGKVLFVGDAAGRMFGKLGPGIIYEDLDEGLNSLKKLTNLTFNIACFGHGNAITENADQHFRETFLSR